MITKNKQVLKRLIYTGLSLSSILLSPEVQAGGYFSKSSSNVEEDTSTSYRHRRQRVRFQKETSYEEGFLGSAIKLRKEIEDEVNKVDNLIDIALKTTISTVAPKMKEQTNNSFVKAIKDLFED